MFETVQVSKMEDGKTDVGRDNPGLNSNCKGKYNRKYHDCDLFGQISTNFNKFQQKQNKTHTKCKTGLIDSRVMNNSNHNYNRNIDGQTVQHNANDSLSSKRNIDNKQNGNFQQFLSKFSHYLGKYIVSI